MDGRYTELIEQTSKSLAEGLLSSPDVLLSAGVELDAELFKVVQALGRATLQRVLNMLGQDLEQELKTPGVWVERRPRVKFKTVFGEVEVASPFLRNRRTGERARPLLEVFGIEGGRHSLRVERALVDFGAEKSFARAAQRSDRR
jgi:hypothetical protein